MRSVSVRGAAQSRPVCNRAAKGSMPPGYMSYSGGVDASVNLVAEGDLEAEEDEDLYVNVARVGQEEDDWQEPDDSWLELDGGESEEEAGVYCINACMRKDDSGLEDKLDYFHNITPPPPEEEEAMEDRWWSPEPRGPRSEEENEEDNQYINACLWATSRSREVNLGRPSYRLKSGWWW
jgi:hypothetical protein